jgi:hypothetical protein
MPPPRQSTNFLRPLAHLLVDALGLEPPTTLDPGHWKTPDGFITVSTSLIKDGFTDRGTPLRALIAFEPRDAQQKAKKNIQARYPDYERMPPEERRGVWGKILLMTKEARKERVAEIVAELDRHGVDLPAHNIVVHRVSNTFFATVNLEILEQIQALRRAHGYDELRRINIEKPAVF